MRLSTKQIDKHAVSAVKERISLSPYLEAYINENDKGPLWDGYICVYKNTERANANIDGRFPVQIKGKEAPDQSKNEITYQFNCDNLRHYLRDGGAMLFVVYLSIVLDADGCDDIKKTIYYNTLTPVKLMQILQRIKRAGQETIAVRLTRLPRASQDLSNICLNFLIDRRKQSSFACTSLPTIEQLLEKGVFDGIVTSVSSYGEMPDPIGSFLQSETYVYAKMKGTDVLMPLNIFPEAKTISETIHANISVNNKLLSLYPMVYSDESYDATSYAKYIMLQELSASVNTPLPQPFRDEIGSAVWERERTTLIKKTCHDPDQEWRMIIRCNIKPPIMLEWIPSGVILGLRTSLNDQKRIIDAAKEAGIKRIYKSCIDIQNKLNFFPIDR